MEPPGGSREIASSPVPVVPVPTPAPPRRSPPWLAVAAVAAVATILAFAAGLGWANLRESVEDPPDGGPWVEATGIEVGQELWYAGFQMQIVEATYRRDELALVARFTNHGPQVRAWSAPLAVADGAGQSFPASPASHLPEAPSGLTASGTLVFAVGTGFDLTSSYLVAGSVAHAQASVPLGRRGGSPVGREPSYPPVAADLSLQLVDLRVTGAELRADIPGDYRQVAAGRLALTLEIELTSRGTRGGGGALLSRNDFALVLPDGNPVAPDGANFVAENVVGAPTGVDYRGFEVRFLVDDPATGEYGLRFRSDSSLVGLAGDGPLEATAPFTLP